MKSCRLLTLAASALLTRVHAAANQSTNPVLLLSQDDSNHFEFVIGLGESIYSGGDVGPLLGVAKDLLPYPGNRTAWIDRWHDLALQTKDQAQNATYAYDPVNVQKTWFSASTYFRRADFYNHGNWDDPRINEFWVEQLAAFDQGLASLPVPGQRVNITTDGFYIPAIWYHVSADNCTKRPTLILGNGYDGSQEDLYHTFVVPALARGWNCITYEGPGHPSVRRFQNLGFIPDWERVVTPVVDHLFNKHAAEVDTDRLALLGYSFGGYLAARAAAFEPRLSAVLLDGGIYNTFESFTSQISDSLTAVLNSGNKTAFDAIVAKLLAEPDLPIGTRWGIEQGLWSFNFKSAYDWLQSVKNYTLEGITDLIQMPVWTADAEYESFFQGQSAKVKAALGDRATYHRFEGPAGYHCQAGALDEANRVIFAWLHDTLG